MIIDAHTHMPSAGWPGHRSEVATVEDAVRYMRHVGTDAALFNMWQGVFAESERDLEEGNAEALAVAERYAGFLFPGVCIHPDFPDASLRWMRHFSDSGYKWVGELVHYHKEKPYRYTDSGFLDLVEYCSSGGFVLQLHSDSAVVDVASRFPALQVVCAHIDVGLCERLAELPNTWMDISGSAGGLVVGAIEHAYKTMGPDRLLYGSDFTGYDPACFQARLGTAVPEESSRQRILGGNVLRLLEMVDSKRPGCNALLEHPNRDGMTTPGIPIATDHNGRANLRVSRIQRE